MLASAVSGIVVHGSFHRSMIAAGVAMIACVVAMIVAAAISFTPRLRTARLIVGQIALGAFLCVPLGVVAAHGANEIAIRLLQRFVARAAPRLEAIRAARGEYPRTVDWPFDGRVRYFSDGRSYSVAWQDGLTCGRGLVYRSTTGTWVETRDPCYF